MLYYKSMSVIFRVILGLLIAFFGVSFVWKTESFFRLTGRINWAESKLGAGGTRLFLKLFGVLVIFIGIFVMTNIASDILNSFASIFVR